MSFSAVIGLALIVQAPTEAPEVICRPTGEVADGAIRNIGLACPPVEIDPEGYLTYLGALLDALPDSVTLPRSTYRSINDAISISHTDDGWRLTEPTVLVRVAPAYPQTAAQNGVSGRCAVRLEITEAGIASVTATSCETFRSGRARSSTLFERKTLEALEQFIWLPMPGQPQTCHVMVMDFLIVEHAAPDLSELTAPDEPVLNAPTCP